MLYHIIIRPRQKYYNKDDYHKRTSSKSLEESETICRQRLEELLEELLEEPLGEPLGEPRHDLFVEVFVALTGPPPVE